MLHGEKDGGGAGQGTQAAFHHKGKLRGENGRGEVWQG